MDEALRRLVGEAIAATGTAAPRVVAGWIVEHREDALRDLLAAYVLRMFGWRDDRGCAAPPRREPEPVAEDLF